jgi:pimeloyl-ACP methyl ester carboxylesterase
VRKAVSLLLNCTARPFPKWNGKLAYKVMCRTRRTEITAEGDAFLNSARIQRTMHVSGYEGTVYTWGYGPKTVLMLHGWAGNSQRWQMYVERLDPAKFTCIALDAPGHGRSGGRELQLEVYRQMVDNIICEYETIDFMLTHSLGSLVAALCFIDSPNLPVKNFIITGAPRGVDAIFDYFQSMLGLNVKVMENLQNHTDYVLSIPAGEVNMKNFFRQVDVRTLILHDKDDRTCPLDDITEKLPHNDCLTLQVTQGYGHNLEDGNVATIITEFICARRKEDLAVEEMISQNSI